MPHERDTLRKVFTVSEVETYSKPAHFAPRAPGVVDVLRCDRCRHPVPHRSAGPTRHVRGGFEITEAVVEIGYAMNRGVGSMAGGGHIPHIGRPGTALSHPTLYPIDLTYTQEGQAEGTIDRHLLTWEENPTQRHVADAPAGLPIDDVTRGHQALQVASARRLWT